MSCIGNTEDINLGCNSGNSCHNTTTIPGCVGPNAAVGNTTGVTVRGNNAGSIGSGNTFDIKGGVGAGQRVGNTSNVNAGSNSGSIGSGNRFNM
ncbi:hyphally-regulated protein-like [Sander lucioperca]|uniref:hyphally-regulated protein-like n=1 Tax=Sander lucioperca TaxID=283035 RepID=UPI00125D9F01|nr:hyphally-regulated protein-like [Sander lucioperca]